MQMSAHSHGPRRRAKAGAGFPPTFLSPALPEGAAAFAKTAVAANAFAAVLSVSVGPKATDAASSRLPAAGCSDRGHCHA